MNCKSELAVPDWQQADMTPIYAVLTAEVDVFKPNPFSSQLSTQLGTSVTNLLDQSDIISRQWTNVFSWTKEKKKLIYNVIGTHNILRLHNINFKIVKRCRISSQSKLKLIFLLINLVVISNRCHFVILRITRKLKGRKKHYFMEGLRKGLIDESFHEIFLIL